MHKLPPLGPGIRVLKTVESERLRSRYKATGSLPSSPKFCSTCGGTKTFRWYKEGSDEIVDYECDCKSQWILERYLLFNGIRRNYQTLDWRDVVIDGPLVDTIVEYVNELDYYVKTGTGLFIYGHTGLGKTMLSALLLKRALSRGKDGHFTTFLELREDYSGGWKDEDSREWFSRKVKNSSLLVIDDPGKELSGGRSMNFSESLLDDVIRTRTSSCLPTIITSNYKPDDFLRAYGLGVSSLLDERTLVREATGTSFRAKVQERTDKELALKLTRPIVAN